MSEEMLRPLIPLNNLTKLSLINVESIDTRGILSCVQQMRKLRELKIIIDGFDYYDDDVTKKLVQKSIITLAKKLPNFEKLCLRGITLLQSTVWNFIRSASNLKEMHIHQCELKITQKFLLKTAQVRESSRRNVTEPLKLFIDAPDSLDLETIQQLGIKDNLCVSTYCNH